MLKEDVQKAAAHVLTNAMKAKVAAKKQGSVPAEHVIKYKKHSKELSEAKREYREIGGELVQDDENTMTLDFLKEKMVTLENQNKEMLGIIQKLLENQAKADGKNSA